MQNEKFVVPLFCRQKLIGELKDMFSLDKSLTLIIAAMIIFLIAISLKTSNYFTESQNSNIDDQILLNLEISDDEVVLSESKVLAAHHTNSVSIVNDSDDLRRLAFNSNFSLIVSDDLVDQVVKFEVQKINKGSSYTQILGKSDNEDTVLITFTETMTNILLKTPYNIYEFVGDNFAGVVQQAKPLGLKDDIHEYEEIAEPLENNFVRKKLKRAN
tara:strand:- start:2696 stop:3340 length:645 start_codon:yes stop_codon:yes gene_type:complete